MSTRMTRVLAALVVLLLAGTLAGCGGSDEKAPRRESTAKEPVKTLEKGTCWDDEQLPAALGDGFDDWVEKYAGGDADRGDAMRDDAAFAEEIDCAEAHSLELYNVIELTPALTAQITDYADLLDQSSPLYRQVRDQVNDRCMAGSAYGQAQRKGGGLPVQLGPSLNVDSGLSVAWDPFPADLWAKGQQKFVCLFQQEQPGTLRFADLPTSRTPIAARVCLNTPGTYLPCTRRHQAEDIGEMVLNTAIEQGKIKGDKRKGAKGPYVAFSDAEYAQLDKICQALFTSVSKTKGGVVGRVYPGAVTQWPTENGAYLASCFAVKPFEPLPPMGPGTVFNRS